MANRNGYTATTTGPEHWEMYIFLTAPGTGTSVTISGLEGAAPNADVTSITHVGGTNTLQVTLKDSWIRVLFADASIRDDAANGAYATIGTIANEGAGGGPITFNVNYFNAAGTALNDPTLVTCIVLSFRNTVSGVGIA